MTKKHFERAAGIVEASGADPMTKLLIALSFRSLFSGFTVRFDSDYFMQKCGFRFDKDTNEWKAL